MREIGIVRKYGKAPYRIVLVHGGPGALGELKPVALELSRWYGTVESFQSKNTIDEQVEELKYQIESESDLPVILIGWSWGSWLSYIFTAKYPSLIKKLILISSGPFKASYVPEIKKRRLSHLTYKERKRIDELEQLFNQHNLINKDVLFKEYGSLCKKADTFSSNEEESLVDKISPQMNIYNGVWPEAAKLRKTGELIMLGCKIDCEVVAMQGVYDSHPSDGVKIPLARILKNFRFIEISKCGHYPWYEKYAKKQFYELLKNELVV